MRSTATIPSPHGRSATRRAGRPGTTALAVGLVASALAAGVLAGCSSDDRAADPGPAQASTTASDAPVSVPFPAVTTTLVAVGENPVSPRYAESTTGRAIEVTYVDRQRIHLPGGEGDGRTGSPSPLPDRELSLTLDARVTAGSAPGLQRVESTVIGTRDIAGSTEGLDRATGFGLVWKRSATGAISELGYAPNAEAPDSARSAIEAAATLIGYSTVVFPDKPVGVGGSWTVSLDEDGSRHVTTYRVVSAAGGRLVLDVEISRADGDSAAGTLRGGGRITVDTAAAFPVGGTVSLVETRTGEVEGRRTESRSELGITWKG